MASNIERRFDLARAALARQAEETGQRQQELIASKFASTGGLESGAAIKAGRAAERALRDQELSGQTAISKAQSEAEFGKGQRDIERAFRLGETGSGRDFAKGQSAATRRFAAAEAAAGREAVLGEEGSLQRSLKAKAYIAQGGRDQAIELANVQVALKQRGIDIKRKEMDLSEIISIDNLNRRRKESQKSSPKPIGKKAGETARPAFSSNKPEDLRKDPIQRIGEGLQKMFTSKESSKAQKKISDLFRGR